MHPRARFLKCRWLMGGVMALCIAALTGCTAPRGEEEPAAEHEKTTASDGSQTARVRTAPVFRFADVTAASGVRFEIAEKKNRRYFFPAIMCGGAALFDFDGDGDLDLLLVGGAPAAGKVPRPPLRLFRQDSPWKFTDVTRGSGLDVTSFAMGVAVGDVNNDGIPDVFVTCFGRDQLFVGRGNGKFEDVTKQSGVDNPAWGASACFVDYDRDGRLDLYVTNYVNYFPDKRCVDEVQSEDFCGPQVFLPTADRLFRNTSEAGKVRFVDVTVKAGIATAKGAGLGVVAFDANDDGWPDLYVANDGTPNFLWINRKDGTFREEAQLLGVATNRLGNSQAGMGIAVGDVLGDGRDSLLVTHLNGEMNALYSRKNGFWRDLAVRSGLGGPSFAKTGFGTAFADLDLDGDLDAIVVNGRVKRTDAGRQAASSSTGDFWADYAEENQLFANRGDGRFLAAAVESPFCQMKETSRGLTVGDIDNDGDLDLVVVNAGAAARLYRNDSQRSGNWITVKAVDPARGGRDMEGAVFTVRSDSRQWRGTVRTASSYLSASDPRVHFGLGRRDTIDSIEVAWPDGRRETFPGGKVNRHVTLRRKDGTAK